MGFYMTWICMLKLREPILILHLQDESNSYPMPVFPYILTWLDWQGNLLPDIYIIFISFHICLTRLVIGLLIFFYVDKWHTDFLFLWTNRKRIFCSRRTKVRQILIRLSMSR